MPSRDAIEERPSTWSAWLAAARPQTLGAAVAPVLVGVAVAEQFGKIRWLPAAACLLGAVLLQIGTNFVNDLADFEKGADDEGRVGPTRAVQAGWITVLAMRRAAVVVFLLAGGVGVYLAAVSGPLFLPVWAAAIVAAVAYTAGPWPLGYLGLGDLFVFLFFGLVAVVGTVYVQTATMPAIAWLAAVPVGCLATAILVVNNLRDRVTDARAGKRTLAVRCGERWTRIEYVALLALAYTACLALAVVLRSPFLLLPALAVPFAVSPTRRVLRREGAALNPALGATARLLLVTGALLAAGLALAPP